MKEMIKNAAILLAITVVAGGVLGTVYEITKDPIAAAEEKAQMEAYQEVFKDAQNFDEISISEDDSTLANGGHLSSDVNSFIEAKDSEGNLLGYVVVVTNHEGYGGDIQMAVGISLDGTTNGISILAIAETPGLGMEAESVLKPQFTNKKADQFEYTKTGASSENQIDAISGATVTTNSVTNGVNAALYYFQENGMKEEGGVVNE